MRARSTTNLVDEERAIASLRRVAFSRRPMAQRKPFLLRLPPDLMEELNRWAKDDLRSLNAQIEYLLRDAARKRGRMKREDKEAVDSDGT